MSTQEDDVRLAEEYLGYNNVQLAGENSIHAFVNAVRQQGVPEGWMQDIEQVKNLHKELENRGWVLDSRGDPDCVDQASAMAAEVIQIVLIPMLSAAPTREEG